MRVTTHDGVDTTDSAGHLEVNVHAVVANDHHHLGAFASGLIDHGLHVLVLNTEGPVGHHVTRVGNGRVGERLTNDGAGYAVDFFNDVGFENLIPKVLCFDVLCNKVNFASEVFFDNLFDAVHAQSKFPMASHDIDTQQFAGIDHVLAICPQASTRALPCITAIK